MEHIPVVDLSQISGEAAVSDVDFASIAAEIFYALSNVGFVYLSHHGIDKNIISKAFCASKTFFELPQVVKDTSVIDTDVSYNGYAKQGIEQNCGIRETYDICGKGRYFPEKCAEFGPALSALEQACKPLVKNLLRVLALSLKLDDKDYFISRFTNLDDFNVTNLTTVRSIYYPSIPPNTPPNAIRCGEHTDYGIITLLFQDDIGGLEVKSVSGKWISAVPIPGTILLNTGDLLERWSGGKFPATMHRVLIPEAERKKRTHRQSIVYFVHPDDNVKIVPLVGNVEKYKVVSAKDHANRKLERSYHGLLS